MLAVFSPIFVVDTKIIFRYDFVAPLTENFIFCAVRAKASTDLDSSDDYIKFDRMEVFRYLSIFNSSLLT